MRKSSTRLRLECLETRSLLSAIGLPFVPPVAPPSASAAAGEFSRIGGQHAAQAAVQDAVQNAAAMPSRQSDCSRRISFPQAPAIRAHGQPGWRERAGVSDTPRAGCLSKRHGK